MPLKTNFKLVKLLLKSIQASTYSTGVKKWELHIDKPLFKNYLNEFSKTKIQKQHIAHIKQTETVAILYFDSKQHATTFYVKALETYMNRNRRSNKKFNKHALQRINLK